MKCPCCGEDSISLLRRLSLGPAFPARCKSCNRKIGVSYKGTLLSMAPYFAALFAIFYIESYIIKSVIMLVSIIISTIINLKFVSLIVVDND